jgi:hypothetical protein
VGNVSLTYQNSTAICVQDPDSPIPVTPFPTPVAAPSPAEGGSGMPRLWWVGLVVGLGALATGAGLAVCLGILWWRRQHRQQQEQEQKSPFELASMQVSELCPFPRAHVPALG